MLSRHEMAKEKRALQYPDCIADREVSRACAVAQELGNRGCEARVDRQQRSSRPASFRLRSGGADAQSSVEEPPMVAPPARRSGAN
jgi:hypothetical protein